MDEAGEELDGGEGEEESMDVLTVLLLMMATTMGAPKEWRCEERKGR